ncbi:DUF421 domain-containing protein [Corynebacterium guangdongense]|uniref:Uncharacterized membrane protein YcaP (DUF421 family) n=1 Tax=Corynebacterium guangdongense TaxID=1783348 RepID=A0ABU1ZVK9_9CORY|nr:YetF domain-containing protein [Corynebacterium guangdongense]MDR7328972.1 uncharacterized membrane protein YcaP (DUF421 family) [Corynebacterium guangdongense]WJZ17545.1 hypothetical protein CGUA_04795 [Corynebacterium guangdongense]
MENLREATNMGPWDQLWFYLGLTPLQALAVALASAALYFFFLLLNKLVGQRLFMKMTGFDMLLVIVLGAIIGRAMMGHTPTFAAGVLVMVVLITLEFFFGKLSGHPRLGRMINNQPVLLIADGELLRDEMRRTRVTTMDVTATLRGKGIHSRTEVAALILERTGEMSVLRKGTPIDADLIADVRSGYRLPKGLIRDR